MSADGPRLLALDFDGVLCDSAGESCVTAWRAFRTLWPEHPAEPPAAIVEGYPRVRPLLETGWENIVLVRLLVDGVTPEAIADGFQERWCPRVIAEHGLDADDLVARFAAARDAWIRDDLDGWLAAQRFYPGVVDSMNRWLDDGLPLYVITTKNHRFAAALVERAGGRLPASRVFGLESGPKAAVLERLAAEHRLAPGEVWFVEDRLATLRRVARVPALAGIGLFLVDWGYNTPDERAAAAREPAITLLTLDRFNGPLARWLPER